MIRQFKIFQKHFEVFEKNKKPVENKYTVLNYLAHKFKKSCHDGDGAAGLFGIPDRVHFATLQNRRPFVHRPLQMFALF